MSLDDRLMVLQRERDAGVARIPCALHQTFAAPIPDLLFRKAPAERLPSRSRKAIAGDSILLGDPRPGQENPRGLGPQIRGHANQLTYVKNLAFPMLRNGAAEVIIRRHAIDLDSFAVRHGAQLAAAALRHVERIAMRPLAVNLNTRVAVLLSPLDHLLQGKSFTSIPDSQKGNAIQAELYVRSHWIQLRFIRCRAG